MIAMMMMDLMTIPMMTASDQLMAVFTAKMDSAIMMMMMLVVANSVVTMAMAEAVAMATMILCGTTFATMDSLALLALLPYNELVAQLHRSKDTHGSTFNETLCSYCHC
jgi:hypothetical protein